MHPHLPTACATVAGRVTLQQLVLTPLPALIVDKTKGSKSQGVHRSTFCAVTPWPGFEEAVQSLLAGLGDTDTCYQPFSLPGRPGVSVWITTRGGGRSARSGDLLAVSHPQRARQQLPDWLEGRGGRQQGVLCQCWCLQAWRGLLLCFIMAPLCCTSAMPWGAA